MAVEPRLGTEQDFRDLISVANLHGMRVILDFVANHCSNMHPAFKDAQADTLSATKDWFCFSAWPDEYAGFWDLKSMPKLNSNDRGVREYLVKSAMHWLDMGVDGFRLDHAHGICARVPPKLVLHRETASEFCFACFSVPLHGVPTLKNHALLASLAY